MSERVEILKEYAEYVFNRFGRTVEGLAEEELDWSPMEESNSMRWILNHLSRIVNVYAMMYIKGDPDYVPEGWPNDYAEKSLELEKLLGDIEKGKKVMLGGLDGLSSADLKAEITRRGTSRTRQAGLFGMLSEIVHHNGQIAYLRGTIKRHREKDPQFLK
jgi:hypothetical protein